MDNREDLVEKIKFLSDSIRKKSRDLKLGIQERERYLETTFKPVINPIKEISRKFERQIPKNDELISLLPSDSRHIKEEEKSETDYDDEDDTNSSNVTDNDIPEENNTKNDEDEEINGESESNDVDEEATRVFVDNSISNVSAIASDIGEKGVLTRKYIMKMLEGKHPMRKCHVYGARVENNKIMIGNSVISTGGNDNLTIKGKTYSGTPGLFELIFKTDPTKYTSKDLADFKKIMKATNAHRKEYSSLAPVYRNKSKKYEKIIVKLFPPRNTKSGRGISMKNAYNTNIIYYNDINKLVDRMRLLHEAKQAGHTGVDNEIIALTQELRNQGYIN